MEEKFKPHVSIKVGDKLGTCVVTKITKNGHMTSYTLKPKLKWYQKLIKWIKSWKY